MKLISNEEYNQLLKNSQDLKELQDKTKISNLRQAHLWSKYKDITVSQTKRIDVLEAHIDELEWENSNYSAAESTLRDKIRSLEEVISKYDTVMENIERSNGMKKGVLLRGMDLPDYN